MPDSCSQWQKVARVQPRVESCERGRGKVPGEGRVEGVPSKMNLSQSKADGLGLCAIIMLRAVDIG